MARDFGVVMYTCPFKSWAKILTQVDEDDLYVNPDESIFGYEADPHVTVIYGLHTNFDHYALLRDIKTFPHVTLKLKAVESFENEEFDVLKITVESEELEELFRFLERKYDNTQFYDGFNPHITVAYLKKGKAAKYLNPKPFGEIKCHEIVYSSPDFEKVYVKL